MPRPPPCVRSLLHHDARFHQGHHPWEWSKGLTEFIPVSSTGHLLLVAAILWLQRRRFRQKLLRFSFSSARYWPCCRSTPCGCGICSSACSMTRKRAALSSASCWPFLPAAMIGATAYKFIKEVLFNPWIVCIFTDHRRLWCCCGSIGSILSRVTGSDHVHVADVFYHRAWAQCLSMIPGVSRSGATIVSAMLLGAERRAAAEFSFWLAMPTMAGAFAYDLYKNHGQMSHGNVTIVAVGFIVSFICAWFVVKTFLATSRGTALHCSWLAACGRRGRSYRAFARPR